MKVLGILLHALTMVLPVWLIGFGISLGESSDSLGSIRFRYEGQSTETGSSVLGGPKTEYSWGEVAMRDSEVRLLQYNLHPSDRKDRSRYTGSILEHFVLDENTLLTCQKSVKFLVEDAPRSLAEAKTIHNRIFSNKTNQVRTRHYFNTVPSARNDLLRGHHFLGMTSDGQIRTLSKEPSEYVEGKPVFEYTSADGTEYRYVCDSERPICWKCSITFPGSREQENKIDPYTRVEELKESAGGYVLTSTATQNPSSRNRNVVRETERIFDVSFNDLDPITLVFTPQNGDRIDSLADSQIKYQWQSGKIEKVYDPLADKGGWLRFVGGSRWMLAVNLVIVLVLAALIYWRWRAAAVLIFAGLFSTPTAARAADSYCGMYALYGSAKSLGIDADLKDLIDAEYISSHRGSTADDLVEAAESIGLEATPLKGLGIETLKGAQHPLILHAAPMGTHAIYQHWILFLGFDEGGKARVVDGAGGVALCTAEDVLARWDGIAIVVRKPDSPPTRFLAQQFAGLSLLIAYGGLFALVIKSGMLTSRDPKRSWRSAKFIHFVALAAASVALGFAFKGQGFTATANSIDAALGLRELPTVTLEELLGKMRAGAVLIDCRYKQDYELGYIEGAISLPVDVGLGDFSRLVADVDRDADVVLYCQSAGCGFSGLTATMLASAGFENLSVFKGGYVEWEQHNDSNASNPH